MKKSTKAIQSAIVETSSNSSQNDNQSTAPVVIATPHKQQTAKEAIAANVQLLIEQLEQGHSEGLTAYLTAMGRFHRYSFGNILEIARQKPLVGFRSAWVWDISSTEGRDLPELSCEVTGDVGAYRERLIDFVIAQGVTLEFKESIAPALGMCYGDRIVLLPGQSPAEEFSTLVHEMAHSFLHRAERRITTTKTVRETEAEAIAFVVGTTIGLNTGDASASYIQLYHGNAALLAESLEVIQKTSALILAALETHAAEPADESEPETSKPPASEPHDTREMVASTVLKKTA
jgi:hypothetical protein